MESLTVLCLSFIGATVNGLGELAELGGLVGRLATLGEDLGGVDVCFFHAYSMAQKRGFFKPPCDSVWIGSVVGEHLVKQGLTGALALCFDADAVALNLDSIQAGLDILELDLKLATLITEGSSCLLKLGHLGVELLGTHGVCLFDELSIGDGGGEW